MKIATTVFTFLVLLGNTALLAQDEVKFTVEVNSDSILMGNYFELKFTLENAQGKNFQAPSLADFNLIGGPNQSSSFSMINGKVNQSLTYTYYLEPIEVGNYFIGPASIEANGKTLETPPVEVIAVPNPDGVIQNPYQGELRKFHIWEDLPLQPESAPEPEKKRKTYRL